MILGNKLYDRLKFVVQIILPALSVFYMSVAPLWSLPKQESVAGTLMALALFLGVCLRISTKQYNDSDASFDGYIDSNSADEDTGNPDLQMTLTKLPGDILEGDVARFKIGPPPRDYKA
jgi:putative holin Dp-1